VNIGDTGARGVAVTTLGGALTVTTNALGQTTQITRHLPGGLPQIIVDANGVTTDLTYDSNPGANSDGLPGARFESLCCWVSSLSLRITMVPVESFAASLCLCFGLVDPDVVIVVNRENHRSAPFCEVLVLHDGKPAGAGAGAGGAVSQAYGMISFTWR
jgi:hypothetical protein